MPRVTLPACLRVRSRTDDGAVAVEFALVLPLLAMLMLGVITFGVAYSNDVALTSAVREGARFGATLQWVDDGDPATNDWATAVVSRTEAIAGDNFSSLDNNDICALLVQAKTATNDVPVESSQAGCKDGSTSAGALPDAPSDIPDDTCVVIVWASVPAQLSWVLGSMEVNVRAESVAAYGRELGC